MFESEINNLRYSLKRPQFDDEENKEMGQLFQIFFFIKIMRDSTTDSAVGKNQNNSDLFPNNTTERSLPEIIFEFFEKNSGSIEIIFDKKVQKLYYIKEPATHFLDEHFKSLFWEKVDTRILCDKATNNKNGQSEKINYF